MKVPHEPVCILRLVVDLDETPPRMPEPHARHAEILGIEVPRLTADIGTARRVISLLDERRFASLAAEL